MLRVCLLPLSRRAAPRTLAAHEVKWPERRRRRMPPLTSRSSMPPDPLVTGPQAPPLETSSSSLISDDGSRRPGRSSLRSFQAMVGSVQSVGMGGQRRVPRRWYQRPGPHHRLPRAEVSASPMTDLALSAYVASSLASSERGVWRGRRVSMPCWGLPPRPAASVAGAPGLGATRLPAQPGHPRGICR